jgi:hypothetical protein
MMNVEVLGAHTAYFDIYHSLIIIRYLQNFNIGVSYFLLNLLIREIRVFMSCYNHFPAYFTK